MTYKAINNENDLMICDACRATIKLPLVRTIYVINKLKNKILFITFIKNKLYHDINSNTVIVFSIIY